MCNQIPSLVRLVLHLNKDHQLTVYCVVRNTLSQYELHLTLVQYELQLGGFFSFKYLVYYIFQHLHYT